MIKTAAILPINPTREVIELAKLYYTFYPEVFLTALIILIPMNSPSRSNGLANHQEVSTTANIITYQPSLL